MYLIQGFFFQQGLVPDIGYDKGVPRALVRNLMLRSMFSGVIIPEEDKPNILVGTMTDHYGESVLRGILIDAAVFHFVKFYLHRTDHIDYRFKKNADGTWHGTFKGKAVGMGQACCVLTPVPENFMLPEDVAERRAKSHFR